MRILGIDPGLRKTGFGVIEVQAATLAYVASGTIGTLEAPRGDLPLRLKLIVDGVVEVMKRYAPDAAAVADLGPQTEALSADLPDARARVGAMTEQGFRVACR